MGQRPSSPSAEGEIPISPAGEESARTAKADGLRKNGARVRKATAFRGRRIRPPPFVCVSNNSTPQGKSCGLSLTSKVLRGLTKPPVMTQKLRSGLAALVNGQTKPPAYLQMKRYYQKRTYGIHAVCPFAMFTQFLSTQLPLCPRYQCAAP